MKSMYNYLKLLSIEVVGTALMKKYSDEELLQMLRDEFKRLGRAPSSKKMKHIRIYTARFGTWNNALELAGLPTLRRNKNMSDEELLDLIRDKYKETGKIPKSRMIPENGIIRRRFGSWNNALEKAGLKPEYREYSKEELLEFIKSKFKELGRVPQRDEIPHFSYIYKYFNSYEDAINASGLKEEREIQKLQIIENRAEKIRKYSNEELIEIIRKKYEELGRVPTNKDVQQYATIIDRFSSWDDALGKIGLKVNREKYTDKQLLQILLDYYKETGETPTTRSLPQISTIKERFGSLKKALKLAGIPRKLSRVKNYSKGYLLKILKERYEGTGEISKPTDFEEYPAFHKYYDSWYEFLVAAGIPVRKPELSEKDMEKIIFKKYRELKRLPGSEDVEKSKEIIWYFGTWRSALKKLKINSNMNSQHSNSELIELIQKLSLKLGRTPTYRDFSLSSIASNRFGSWNKALEKAGLPVTSAKWTDDTIIDIIKR